MLPALPKVLVMVYSQEVPQTILSPMILQNQMPRYRSRMALRPINRIKHVVDFSAALTGGTQLDDVIATTSDTPTLAAVKTVETGSKINGFYLRVEIASNETIAGAIPNCYLMIWKNPGGNITAPACNAVGANDNKRFVFHQEMIMFDGTKGRVPRTLFNGVIVVPKGMRRMAPNDVIQISVLSTTLDAHVCYQVHYKEFR